MSEWSLTVRPFEEKTLGRFILGFAVVALTLAIVCVSSPTHGQTENVVEIQHADYASGPFRTGDIVEIRVSIRNISNESLLSFIGLTFRSQKGVQWDVPPRPIFLRSREEGEVTFLWTVPQDAPSGEYGFLLCVWKGVSGTLMTGALARLTVERAFSVIGPPVRAGDILFFALTIVPRLVLSLFRREEERSSVFMWTNGATCHAFALILWNVPFKTEILASMFWVFVVCGYVTFLALAFKDKLMKRRGLILASFQAPSSLMIGTLFHLYFGNDLTTLMLTSSVLFVLLTLAALRGFGAIVRNDSSCGESSLQSVN